MAICRECHQEYFSITSDNGLCWNCNNKGFDYTSDWTYTVILPTYGNHEDYSYVEYLGNYMLYKVEDDWFVWTESDAVDKWEEGIIYKSRNMADFVEHLVDFINEPSNLTTGTFDHASSDFNTQ